MTTQQIDAVSPAVKEVADKVRALVAQGALNPFSVVDIIRSAARVGASWDAVEDVVTEIAKGADGIGGTADDLIPLPVMALISTMLSNGVVRDIVAWATEVDPAAPVDGKPAPWWKRLCGAVRRRVTRRDARRDADQAAAGAPTAPQTAEGA